MPIPQSARPQLFQPDTPLLPGWNLRLDQIRDFLGNQEKDNWCWAAVTALATKMLHLNNDQGFTQTEIVSRLDPTLADKTNTLLNSWFAVGINAVTIGASQIDDDLNNIFARVDRGEPVGIYIDWIADPPVPGHALCAIATGSIKGEPALAVYDPAQGGDLDNILQLTITGLNNYYAGDTKGLRGYWSAAIRVD